MKKLFYTALPGLTFLISISAHAINPTAPAEDSFPILPKVWMGVAGDTSIGAISRKNPFHYLHVGKDKQVKGWNAYDGPASITVLRQDGRHLELQFKNPKYQINEVGTLSSDGKQIQIASKEASGLFTIEGNKIMGCGSSSGTNGLFEHWLGSYSAWCDEYVTGNAPTRTPTSSKSIPVLPKVWTGILSATNIGNPTLHVPNHEANVTKGKSVDGWSTHDEAPRTIKIVRQEGRHLEFLYQSPRSETKFIGMLSVDGKQMQVTSGYSWGTWSIAGDKISGCAFSRGMDGSFDRFFNHYQTYCVDFVAGAKPPAPPQDIPLLPKEWRGTVAHTNFGFGGKFNSSTHPSSTLQFNSYDEARTLVIEKQDGRHLRLLYKTANNSFPLIGTISSDGKQIAIANNYTSAIWNVDSDSLMGCGLARGGKATPTFDDWKDSYASFCVNMKTTQ